MSDASDILAKIDRRKARLRANPIKIIAPWPKLFSLQWQRNNLIDSHMQDRARDSVYELWSMCLRESSRTGPPGPWTGGPVHGVWSYDVHDFYSLVAVLYPVWAVIHDPKFEQVDDDIKLFARTIELQLLERLT